MSAITDAVTISDDALKLMVAEHGVRGTARMLGFDQRQTDAFRQRVTRQRWLQDPAIAQLRAQSGRSLTRSPDPLIAKMSPAQAAAAELASVGAASRLSLARGVKKAAEHVETMNGDEILSKAQEVKAITQTASTIHGWQDQSPTVKLRLDILGAAPEAPAIEVESEIIESGEWPEDDKGFTDQA